VPADSLTRAVAQPACTALDVSANVVAHAVLIRAAAARVVVFPELSLTGYELNADLLDPADPRLSPLVGACAMTGATALVGAPVAGPHIATLAVDRDGVRVAYRKMHPGGGESRFRPGPAPAVLTVAGWRLGLAICRDTGVPGHPAATAALGIDAYLAGLVDHPYGDVVRERRAHDIATGHRVWVGFAGFAGPTGSPYPETAGRSGIWAPDGTALARAGRDPNELVRAELTRPPVAEAG
jgi:predicted amidohydrolase